jgi:two-component system, chemotaxis family, protein-glutamate methylesterase/glutaminase
MGGHDIIVIGASMGGVKALQELVRGMPPNLQAAVLIVQHTDPRSPGLLAGILDNVGPLRAATAVDGEPIAFGEIRVARPDHHLMLESDRVRVIHGPKENRSRPAIDTLFRSAALAYGSRVIGVVLTGRLDDGTAGLWTIKRAGGIAVVQDPDDAEFPDMPKNASDAVEVDHSVPLSRMAGLLTELAATPSMPVEGTVPPPDEEHYVPAVVYVCPDCNGPLREIKTGNEKLVRFKCLVGHAFSMATLLEGHAEATEAALWTAVVSLEHEAMFAERAAQHAATRNERAEAVALTAEAKRAREQGNVIRGLLTANPSRKHGDA